MNSRLAEARTGRRKHGATLITEDSAFNWHHLPGWAVFAYVGVKEMFRFFEKIWPKQVANGNGRTASELRIGEIVRDEVEPLRNDIRKVDDKLDKHIQWHLEHK